MNSRSRWPDLAYFALYVVLIYFTLPYTPYWAKSIAAMIGEGNFRLLVIFFVALSLTISVIIFSPRLVGRSVFVYIGLAIVLACYIYFAVYKIPIITEKIHLIEYGIVSYLALRIARGVKPVALEIAIAIAIVFLVGYCDELLQRVLPNRVSTFEDVMLNLKSGTLGVVFLKLLGVTRDGKD